MGIEDLTQEELFAELDRLVASMVPPVGAFPVSVIMDRYGWSEKTARRWVYNQVDAGKFSEWGEYKGTKYFVLVTP